ncbi:MAG: hypothetical protein H8E21_11195 [Gammaproteobacteria bacterium]|nr:hypothetical protein [Gammaproteobacteria bacterium]
MIISSLPLSLPSQLKASDLNANAQPLSATKSKQSEESSTTSASQERNQELSDQRELQKLKNRDTEVRAHELAHVAVGSRYITSGAQFQYQKGSDGRLYAVAGEVSIDTSPVPDDPRATLMKAQVIARAAMAPAVPSAQDRAVAAQASAMIQQARAELALVVSAGQLDGSEQGLDVFA